MQMITQICIFFINFIILYMFYIKCYLHQYIYIILNFFILFIFIDVDIYIYIFIYIYLYLSMYREIFIYT